MNIELQLLRNREEKRFNENKITEGSGEVEEKRNTFANEESK